MARPRKATGSDQIEAEVRAIGSGIGKLVKTLEQFGATINAQKFDQVFSFLGNTLAKIEAQARKDRLVISAGEFSFDAPGEIEIPLKEAPPSPLTYRAEAPLPQTVARNLKPQEGEKPSWVKPTGRIAKSSPNTDLAGAATHVRIGTKTAPDKLDAATGITFLSPNEESKIDNN